MQPTVEDAESPSVDPLCFVLDDQPERSTDRSATRVLEVVHIFGDSVTEVRHLMRTARLTFGNEGDLMVPAELVDPAATVAAWVDDAWEVQADPRWAPRLVTRGEAQPCPARIRLGDGAQLVMDVGPMTLVLREVWRSRRLPVPIGAEVDTPFLALSALVVAVASLTGWVGSLVPPPELTTNGEAPDAAVLIMRMPPMPDARTRAPDKSVAQGSGGTAAGSKRPSLTKSDRPLAGTPKPAGILGVFSDRSVASVFGEVGLPSAMQEGIDGLQAASSGGPPGPGLNGRCVGPDCLGIGIAAGSGIGDIGPRGKDRSYGDPTGTIERSKASAKLIVDDPILIGNLNPSDIDKVVKRHLQKIRYCYQRELQKTPDMSGKVKIKFTIAKDGSVSSANASVSTLNNAATEACIARTFHQMVFPEPKGGGVAIVSYPFLFAPG